MKHSRSTPDSVPNQPLSGHRRTALIANPSSDVYGSDLQMLQTVAGLRKEGWHVIVAVPERGELTQALERYEAEVRCVSSPVLRRTYLTPKGILKLGHSVAAAMPRLVRVIRSIRPDVVYVNTETIPWWLLAARAAGVPTICHVHEAEVQDARIVRLGLDIPLLLAKEVITNGPPATEAIMLPGPRSRAQQIYNGVPTPEIRVDQPCATPPFRTAVVGRLSPRKATDVALEAVALARRRGRDVTLDICGTPFSGYEWYEDELRTRARQPDLAGAVRFVGYVSPIWPVLARTHALLAPSFRESFGNVVVEAQMAGRPVIAAGAMGHLQTVSDESTGLLVEPDDPEEMADAMERLMDDGQLRESLARRAEQLAVERFSLDRYHHEIVQLLTRVSDYSRCHNGWNPTLRRGTGMRNRWRV